MLATLNRMQSHWVAATIRREISHEVARTAFCITSTGFISSSSIDFGDRTVQNAVGALHTYADSQPHDVTATITDVDGVTSVATATADGTGPSFGFGVSPANATLHAGGQTVIDLNISPNNGPFNNAVSLACESGLPAGAACAFSPSSVTPGSAPPLHQSLLSPPLQ